MATATTDVTFGLDVSSHQAGIDLVKAAKEGFDFVSIKLTEGGPGCATKYVSPFHAAQTASAKAAGMLVNDYHAMHKGNAVAQADWHCSNKPDKSVPSHVDFEPFGDNPSLLDVLAFIRRCKNAHGVSVKLCYFPHWYWATLGSILMKGLPKLISSNYSATPANSHASTGYKAAGGNNGVGWKRYGGKVPFLWQFTSTGIIDSWNPPAGSGLSRGVDCTAFRGTRAQLAASGTFKDFAPKPPAPVPPPTPTPTPAPTGTAVHIDAAIKNLNATVAELNAALAEHTAPKGPVHLAIEGALTAAKGALKLLVPHK